MMHNLGRPQKKCWVAKCGQSAIVPAVAVAKCNSVQGGLNSSFANEMAPLVQLSTSLKHNSVLKESVRMFISPVNKGTIHAMQYLRGQVPGVILFPSIH